MPAPLTHQPAPRAAGIALTPIVSERNSMTTKDSGTLYLNYDEACKKAGQMTKAAARHSDGSRDVFFPEWLSHNVWGVRRELHVRKDRSTKRFPKGLVSLVAAVA